VAPYEGKILIVACAAVLDIGDGSFAVVRDIGGYRRECTRTKDLGLPVRWAIRPSQIEIANEVFSPVQEEVDRLSSWPKLMRRRRTRASELLGMTATRSTQPRYEV
jgi:hypothetical protein